MDKTAFAGVQDFHPAALQSLDILSKKLWIIKEFYHQELIMLRSMRSGKFFKYIFLALLAMAGGGLVLMDVQGVLTNRGGQAVKVAEVDGEKITGAELGHLVNLQLQRLKISSADAYRAGLPFRILNDEINSRIFNLEAQDAGIRVDDATAAVAIRDQIVQPLAAQGLPQDQALQYMLQRMGLSEQQLMNNVKMQIAAESLMRIVTAGAYAPDQMVTDALKYRNEARRGEYITLKTSELAKVGEPSAEEIEAYYTQKQSRYMLPEFRTLQVLVMDAKSLGIDAAVTDAEIQAYYDEHIADYSTPETREILQVSLDSEEAAQKLRTAAANGGLKKAVQAAGDDSLDLVTATYSEQDVPEELQAAVFKDTKPGEVSAPVETPFGWHLVEVVKVTEAGTKKPLADVRGEIEKNLSLAKTADAIYKRIEEVEDMAAGHSSMAEIAAEIGVTPVEIAKIDADGLTGDTFKKPAAAEKLPMFDKVLEYGFTLQEGEVSSVIETQDASFLVVSPVEVFKPAAKPLADVKKDVIAAWKEDKKNEALDKTASDIMTRLNLGGKLEDIAKEYNKPLERSKMLRRDSDAKDAVLGRGMIPALFSLDMIGQTTTVRGDNSLSFLRLAERKIDMADQPDAAEINKQRLSLEQSMRGDIVNQFRAGLMDKYKVEINAKAIEDMYASNEAEE